MLTYPSLKVSNLQRFSVDDGPGIRTTVFLKGCNLRCMWCHNPENITATPTLQYKAALCVGCGKCQQTCLQGVHQITSEGQHIINRTYCNGCGNCPNVCVNHCLVLVGKEMGIDELLPELLRDKAYFDVSDGGITFSGGEPVLQHSALKEALRCCREAGLHTAVDTAGAVPYVWLEELLPFVDLFLYDLKCISSDVHKKYIGIENEIILHNIQRLGKDGAAIFLRTPLINGVNTDFEELNALADFAASLQGIQRYQLLPYHNYGVGKYQPLGLPAPVEFTAPSEESREHILQIFLDRSLPVEFG